MHDSIATSTRIVIVFVVSCLLCTATQSELAPGSGTIPQGLQTVRRHVRRAHHALPGNHPSLQFVVDNSSLHADSFSPEFATQKQAHLVRKQSKESLVLVEASPDGNIHVRPDALSSGGDSGDSELQDSGRIVQISASGALDLVQPGHSKSVLAPDRRQGLGEGDDHSLPLADASVSASPAAPAGEVMTSLDVHSKTKEQSSDSGGLLLCIILVILIFIVLMSICVLLQAYKRKKDREQASGYVPSGQRYQNFSDKVLGQDDSASEAPNTQASSAEEPRITFKRAGSGSFSQKTPAPNRPYQQRREKRSPRSQVGRHSPRGAPSASETSGNEAHPIVVQQSAALSRMSKLKHQKSRRALSPERVGGEETKEQDAIQSPRPTADMK